MNATTGVTALGTHMDLSPAMATLTGAVLGGIAGYLFLSARGARARHDLSLTASHLFGAIDAALAGWTRLQQRVESMRAADVPFVPGGAGSASTAPARQDSTIQ